MPIPPPICPPVDPAGLRPLVTARVLYADTDKMGIAYHAAYFRYLELARVELIRGAGVPYTELEDAGLALPLSDAGVRYLAPALYDDLMTIEIGLSLVTRVRVHFDYRVRVLAGDRRGLDPEDRRAEADRPGPGRFECAVFVRCEVAFGSDDPEQLRPPRRRTAGLQVRGERRECGGQRCRVLRERAE